MNKNLSINPCMSGSGVLVEISPTSYFNTETVSVWWDGGSILINSVKDNVIVVRSPIREFGHISIVEVFNGPIDCIGIGFYVYDRDMYRNDSTIPSKKPSKREESLRSKQFVDRLAEIEKLLSKGFSAEEIQAIVKQLKGIYVVEHYLML